MVSLAGGQDTEEIETGISLKGLGLSPSPLFSGGIPTETAGRSRERERRNNNKHVRGYFPFAFRKNFIIFSFFASTQVGPALPSEYLRGILTGAQLLLMVLFFSFSSLSRETERDG